MEKIWSPRNPGCAARPWALEFNRFAVAGPLLLIRSMPAVTVVAPLYVLVPPNTSVPVPSLVTLARPLLPSAPAAPLICPGSLNHLERVSLRYSPGVCPVTRFTIRHIDSTC